MGPEVPQADPLVVGVHGLPGEALVGASITAREPGNDPRAEYTEPLRQMWTVGVPC